ncbi:MAG: hypothetical protein RR619_06600, partial [Raoultibacter sp.]
MKNKKKMKRILIGLLIVVLIVGLSIVWKSYRLTESTIAAEDQTQGQEQNAPAEDQTVENTSDASERLNERQQVIVSQYSDVEKEVAALLESNVWAAGSSSATLRFGENTYTESREGSPDVIKTYVITACKLESSSIDEHGEYTTTYTFAIDTGDKEYIVALSQLHP